MATESPTHLFSYDEYAAIDDGHWYQVLDGELVMTPSPSLRHQGIQAQLIRLLGNHVHATKQGRVFGAPSDVVLRSERPAVVLQPDVLYVGPDRKDILTEANVQGAPSLVVEILSPSTARMDRMRKLALYARYGIPEVWFVPFDVDWVEVLRLDGDRYGKPAVFQPGEHLESPELPGLSLPVAELFD